MHKSEAHGFDWWHGESLSYRRAMVATARAAAAGTAVPITAFAWEATWRPYCDSPRPVSLEKPGKDAGAPVQLNLLAPCRKCARCLQFRQMKWRQRAINELMRCHQSGRRSWWITLTFSPEHLAGIMMEARIQSGGFADLQAIDRAAYKHVQGYLDRVRKASKAQFRYLAIYERGEEHGRSHYHLLLHEKGGNPVLKRTIETRWRSHVHARLVHVNGRSSGLATYITKYATKAVEVRPRASLGYGRTETRARRARKRMSVF